MEKKSLEEILVAMWSATANVFSYYSPVLDYSYAQTAMRTFNESWDPLKEVKLKYALHNNEYEIESTVFEAWADAVIKTWEKGSKSKADEFLDALKKDLDWWKLKGVASSERDNICAKILLSVKRLIDEDGIVKKWFDMWLDSGWLSTESLKNVAMLRALSFSCASAVKRIGESIKDINAEINPNKLGLRSEVLELLKQEYKAFLFSETKGPSKTAASQRRNIHFVQSLACLNALESLGVELSISEAQELMSRNNTFFATGERTGVMDHLSKVYISQKKSEAPQETLWPMLEKASSLADIARALGSVKWEGLRGIDGENVLHILAKNNASAFAKYAQGVKRKALLNEKNKNGETPWNTLLNESELRAVAKVLEKVQPEGKLNWSETMMKAIAVDKPNAMRAGEVAPSQRGKDDWNMLESIFKEDMAERAKYLKTKDGQELMGLVEKNFKIGSKYGYNNPNFKNSLAPWIILPTLNDDLEAYEYNWNKFATTQVEWKLGMKETMKEAGQNWDTVSRWFHSASKKLKKAAMGAIAHGINLRDLESEVLQTWEDGKSVMQRLREKYDWEGLVSAADADDLKKFAGVSENVAKPRKNTL